MSQLVIIRGVSGSGKSTLAKTFLGYYHAEADSYFMKNGVYQFDPTKLKHAHILCQNVAREALNYNCNVVVSNTFTRIWEMQPYLNMAAKYHAEVKVIRCVNQYQNVHGVPEKVVLNMKERFEDYIGEILYNGEQHVY